MRGTILGPTECAIGGVVLPRGGETAPALVWSVAGSTQVDEGDPGAYTVSYTGATLAPGQTATISVATATGGLTWPDATAGSDYTALSAVLTFSAGGATEKTVAVPTIDDTEVEGTEDFRVTIGGASVGTPGTSEANTTIASEDNGDLLLDLVPGAVQAYSMRKLRAAYAGNCIRLRRSSDNAEADFGFDGAGDLDIAAISGWLGGATGHVVTWYDQSGNGFDVTQSTAGLQPEWRSDGLNELPSLTFVDANNDGLIGVGFTTVNNCTIASVQVAFTTGLMMMASGSLTDNYGIQSPSGIVSGYFGVGGTTTILPLATAATVPHLLMSTRAESVCEVFQNGGSLGTGSIGNGAFRALSIGKQVSASNSFDGELAEIILWGDDLISSERQMAEVNINAYWRLWA